jgi:proteasome alpha subunit
VSMPFYVSPEQLMKDRADYARKGIARGRSVVVLQYDDGIAFATQNPSRALHKISEIYDRIAFAAVGKYNEFENLRVAGVRYADLRGYSYDRSDVTARGLANAYAQTLGTVFTTESKPLEVEIVVAEVADEPSGDQIYRLSYDGSVADEHGVVAMGGQADELGARLREEWHEGMSLPQVLALATRALGTGGEPAEGEASEPQDVPASQLEAAVLERTARRRAFRRLPTTTLEQLLGRR